MHAREKALAPPSSSCSLNWRWGPREGGPIARGGHFLIICKLNLRWGPREGGFGARPFCAHKGTSKLAPFCSPHFFHHSGHPSKPFSQLEVMDPIQEPIRINGPTRYGDGCGEKRGEQKKFPLANKGPCTLFFSSQAAVSVWGPHKAGSSCR